MLVQSIFIFISAGAAAFSAYMSYKTYKVSHAADVIAYLTTENDGAELCFDVENLGASAAYNISFAFDKSVPLYDDDRGALEGSFLFTGLPMLAPKARRHKFFVHTRDFKMKLNDQPITVTVSYSDKPRRKPTERGKFVLDATTLGDKMTEID